MAHPAKFAIADAVRIKPGVMDPDYPDIPLGGWRGTISQVWELSPPLYLVQWNEATLGSIHPIYRDRCQRDGFVLEEIWLSEEELEADLGEPVVMEQPTDMEGSCAPSRASGETAVPSCGSDVDESSEEEMLTLAPGQPAIQVHEPPEFPAGTVAFYGPDDKTTTKIVAGVILRAGAEPILRQWTVVDFDADLKLQQEMRDFFREHGVKSVAVNDGNSGCPHEEGKDFPAGSQCPFCPWWRENRTSPKHKDR